MKYTHGGEVVCWNKRCLRDIEELLPEDSIHRNHLEETGHEGVWIHEGDLTLGSLNLDWQQDASKEDPMLVLIMGNLTVEGNVLNENTESAISLMVFGDFQANHVEVGGQEIYIKGNVHVKGVYCGMYNHGLTVVKGSLQGYVLINGDYTYEVEGEYQCSYIFGEGGIYTPEGVQILQSLFIEEAFYYDFFDKSMAFSGVSKILMRNQCPFNPQVGAPTF